MLAADLVVIGPLIGVAVTAVLGGLTYFVSKRTSDDSTSLGLIKASQDWSQTAIANATNEVVQLRMQIVSMQATYSAGQLEMQGKLDRALAVSADTEKARAADLAEIVRLQRELAALHQPPPPPVFSPPTPGVS